MSESANHGNGAQHNLNDQINNLELKYSALAEKVELLEKSKDDLKDNIKSINDNINMMNGHIEQIIRRLDSMAEGQKMPEMEEMKEKVADTVKKGISLGRGLRRLAVGTVRSFLAVGDAAYEAVSSFREGVEDLIAEAQYENRKRRRMSASEEA